MSAERITDNAEQPTPTQNTLEKHMCSSEKNKTQAGTSPTWNERAACFGTKSMAVG
jgi:hypothetical protein